MGEKLFDDLARALAQPMPRRRALRLLGTTIVAFAVPGMRPTRARSFTAAGCGPDVRACPRVEQGAVGDPKCCGAPARRFSCQGTIYEPVCVDTCGGINDIPCKSPKKDDDGYSYFTCCKRPDSIRCADGDCVPNCDYPDRKAGMIQCGKTCCLPSQRCKGGKCVECPPAKLCGSVCCNSAQKCKAGKCVCKEAGGTACGATCCAKGEFCDECTQHTLFDGYDVVTGQKKCCPKGSVCCGDTCFRRTSGICCNGKPCPRGMYCAQYRRAYVCCPQARYVHGSGECCPDGTVATRGGDCCPPGQTSC